MHAKMRTKRGRETKRVMNNDGENVADICLIEAEEKKSENGENR